MEQLFGRKKEIEIFNDALVFPVMITPLGCEKNMHYLGLITHQLDLDCLFAE
jgi:hypothetical protein